MSRDDCGFCSGEIDAKILLSRPAIHDTLDTQKILQYFAFLSGANDERSFFMPVFDFNNTPEPDAVPECTYTTFASDENAFFVRSSLRNSLTFTAAFSISLFIRMIKM